MRKIKNKKSMVALCVIVPKMVKEYKRKKYTLTSF